MLDLKSKVLEYIKIHNGEARISDIRTAFSDHDSEDVNLVLSTLSKEGEIILKYVDAAKGYRYHAQGGRKWWMEGRL